MKQQRKMNYEAIGRRVVKLYPKIAKLVFCEDQKILNDYTKIAFLAKVFSDYYEIDFPKNLKTESTKESTIYRMKFTALCLVCFDPETISGPYYKNIKTGLRQEIGKYLKTEPTIISQYLPRIRFYLHRLADFKHENQQLISIVKARLTPEIL